MVSRITAKASWPTLPSGPEIVRPDEVARIDFGLRNELVDLDRPGGFQRELLKLFLGHFDELVLLEHIALDDVFVGDFLAGVGIDLQILDPMAGLPVELVERDLLRLRSRRIERDRASDQGQTQEAFPVGTWGHETRYSENEGGRIQDERQTKVPTA
jgi:hypothetical protein